MIEQTLAMMLEPGVVGPIAVFTMIIFVVWFAMRTAQASIRAQADLRHKLIDKLSPQELSAFLESKGGQEFMRGCGPRRRGGITMRSLGFGVILTVLGLALLETEAVHRYNSTPGIIVLALGIGFLILAGISRKMAAKGCGNGGSDHQLNPPA